MKKKPATRAATKIRVSLVEDCEGWHVILTRSGNDWYLSKGYASKRIATTRAKNLVKAANTALFMLGPDIV
jgi:hypothetical protein